MPQFLYNNLYQIIEKNSQDAPQKIIIFEEKLKLTNYQFKNYVDKVANFLYAQGIRHQDKVAIIMGNCWQFIVNIFAISKLGAIVVPINNFLKEEELSYILNDSEAKLLFSATKFKNQTQNLISKTTIIKIVWLGEEQITANNNFNYDTILNTIYPDTVDIDSDINTTAVIVYTSGTTGLPKGAMLSFKNIFSNCQNAKIALEAKDNHLKMLCYLPMFHAFTLTVTIILPIYVNNAVIVISSIKTKADFKNLLKQLLLKRCRYFTGVPEIFNAMTKAKLPWYFHMFHSVIGFISGAAPLLQEISGRFSQNFSKGALLQGYGISECSPIVSCNTPKYNKVGSVGRAFPDYQVEIFDDNMQKLARDAVGEICVKGDCVMQGYYNRVQETKDAIIDGWFKTGDVGFIDDEGYIFIVDRKKDIIISKGINIYPSEIERVINSHESVNASAVVGDSNSLPIAYIELNENTTLAENELKEFIKPHLANFKLPRKIIFLEKLPRNATGKILKRNLGIKNE